MGCIRGNLAGGLGHYNGRIGRAGQSPSAPLLDWRAMDLDVDTARRGEASVLNLRGEIDVYTAPRLRQALIDLVDSGAKKIVVDMENVDFLDSTGLGVLVGSLKRVKGEDGTMAIVATQDKILKIFDITGLNKVFPMYESVEEAASA